MNIPLCFTSSGSRYSHGDCVNFYETMMAPLLSSENLNISGLAFLCGAQPILSTQHMKLVKDRLRYVLGQAVHIFALILLEL
jgi:hypothetical protein